MRVTPALVLALGALTVDARRSRRACAAKAQSYSVGASAAAAQTTASLTSVAVPESTDRTDVDWSSPVGSVAASATEAATDVSVEQATTVASSADAQATDAQATDVSADESTTVASAVDAQTTDVSSEDSASVVAYEAAAEATDATTEASTQAASATTTASASSATPTLPVPDADYIFTESSTAEDIAGSSALSSYILSYYNQWRAEFGSGEVVWNTTLAQKASDLMGACKWDHASSNNDNNLAAGPVYHWTVNSMLDMWANEYTAWDFANPDAGTLSHFTMMVWKETTQIGCGWSYDVCSEGSEKEFYLSCSHWTPGNYVGEAAANVGSFIG